MIKVAVIGYGHLGKWHCEKAAYLNSCELVCIVEQNPDNKKKAAEKHPTVKILDNIEEALPLIDAAIIVTPTSTHFHFIEILLKANKHIFCEKPLCTTEEEVLKIKDMYQNKSLVFQVGHSERFHKAWQIIESDPYYNKFITATGTLKINRLAPFKGRATDVDVVQDLMVHDVDLLVFLFGEVPYQVKSTGYKIRTQKYDYVCSEFEFKSGKRAIVTVGRNHVREVRDLEYTSLQGCMYIDMFSNEVLVAPKEHVPPEKKKLSEFVEVLSYDKQDHLLIEQEYFYKAIDSGVPAIVTFEDGVLAVRLINKVIESLESGQTVNI